MQTKVNTVTTGNFEVTSNKLQEERICTSEIRSWQWWMRIFKIRRNTFSWALLQRLVIQGNADCLGLRGILPPSPPEIFPILISTSERIL